MRWVGGGGLNKKDAWVELQTMIEKGFVTTGESVIEAVGAWVVATGERRRERARTEAPYLPAAAENAMGCGASPY